MASAETEAPPIKMSFSVAKTCVYKFLGPERTTYLRDSLLRFTQPTAQNDPFECFPAAPSNALLELVKELRDQVGSGLPLSAVGLRRPGGVSEEGAKALALEALDAFVQDKSILLEQFRAKHNSVIGNNVGLFCVSRRWNSTLMWSHYAASHEGFCVGFDRGHSYFGSDRDDRSTSPLLPVRYSAARPQASLKLRATADDILGLVLTKALDWQYEEEERMVDLLTNAARVIDAVPHKIALFEVPHSAIAEFIIGARSAEAVANEIQIKAKALGVPVYRASMSTERYDLERFAIDG